MILDRLEALDFYGPLIPNWDHVGAFLRQSGYTAFAPGRYEIPGTESYVLVQNYRTADRGERRWESHRRHLDIQILLSGRETVGWRDIEGLTVAEPYSAEKDVAFYQPPEQSAEVLLEAGSFCVFYPGDGHQPGWHREPGDVVKAVVKVRL
jgi:YhcH/YjgK/YiaL family protein